MTKSQQGIEEFNIKMYEDSQWTEVFQWVDKKANPIDITGWGAKFMVKQSEGLPNTDAVIDLDHTNGIKIYGSSGLLIITVNASLISNWNFMFGRHSLEVFPDPSLPDQDNIRLVKGNVKYFESLRQ